MTTSKFNTVVIAAIAAVFSFVFGVNNASAQSLTQTQLDSLNMLNIRTIQASISDKAHKDFKWISEGKATSNKIEVTNRRGFLIGAEAGYNFNHGYEAGLKVGYQGAGYVVSLPKPLHMRGRLMLTDRAIPLTVLKLAPTSK